MQEHATVVFSLESLHYLVLSKPSSQSLTTWQGIEQICPQVLVRSNNGHLFVLDERSTKPKARVVLNLDPQEGFPGPLNRSGLINALRRIHRIGLQAAKRRLTFPRNWNQYVADNKVAIFAYPIYFGPERLVGVIESDEIPTAYISNISSNQEQLDLNEYDPDLAPLRGALENYQEAAKKISASLRYSESETLGVVDLEALTYGAVLGSYGYADWLSRLSPQQRSFVFSGSDGSIKLRGPAGSGKTLALMLKVLHEAHKAEEAGRDIRILFLTHSWGVADQVQEGLERLDEKGVLRNVDVIPLLTLAEFEAMPESVSILGEDSFSGKQAQLKELEDLVARARSGKWPTFRDYCTEEFLSRVEATPGSPEANRFLWDLMLEFACVIGAKGILPGFNALEKYKDLERRPWMMPLASSAEQEFVFYLYECLVQELLSRGLITTDQMICDYLSLLSTYRWHADRREEGYDLIFVDEFHLFNEQERMVLHHLSRDVESVPIVFMAMDPRQSPTETYVDFRAPDVQSVSSGLSERMLGETGSVDLTVVYRYTPEILEFLQLLDRNYPALELGRDWGVSVDEADTIRESGSVPRFFVHRNTQQECEEALLDAEALKSGGRRVAVLCLDSKSFEGYKQKADDLIRQNVQVIESRDDVDSLKYTKQSLVLSQPHYVAGLQFDAVVIGGCQSEFYQYNPHQAYSLRRFLSDMYLGASRSRDVLHIHATQTEGEFPSVLTNALETGVLRLENGVSRP